MLTYTLDVSEFTDLFDKYNRGGNFTNAARRALFNYLDDLSEDMGEDFRIDIIALCCEWSEYTQNELKEAYGYLVDDCIAPEYRYETLLELLNDRTIVMEVNQGLGREDTLLLVNF